MKRPMQLLTYMILVVLSVNLTSETAEARSRRRARHQAPVRADKCEAPVEKFAGLNCKRPGTEQQCMVCNLWFEDGHDSRVGQLAVGQNVMTRKASGAYPRTVCGVVYQGQHDRYAQYSWTKKRRAVLPRGGADLCQTVESALTALKSPPGYATHYLASWMKWKDRPRWAKTCPKLYTKGGHDFFRCPGIISASEIAAATPKQVKAEPKAIAKRDPPKPTPRPDGGIELADNLLPVPPVKVEYLPIPTARDDDFFSPEAVQ